MPLLYIDWKIFWIISPFVLFLFTDRSNQNFQKAISWSKKLAFQASITFWPYCIFFSIFRYVGINVGAPTRAVMLEDHWSFVCTCKRCLDPTELGTYASALRCLACGPGSEALILPMVNKLDGAKATKWCCNTCEMELSREQVEAIVETGLRIIKYVNVSFLFTIERDFKNKTEKTFSPSSRISLLE